MSARTVQAELDSAKEYQDGWDAGLKGRIEAVGSLVYEAGRKAGHNERVNRAKEVKTQQKRLRKAWRG